MSGLSLFGIESGLHELVEAWQEAQTPEDVAQAEQTIKVFVEAEVRKVDNIRSYLRFCDTMEAAAAEEAKLQQQRKQMWAARRDRLKAFVYGTMQAFGVRKLEGKTGALSIRGNGGLEPLMITDASMLPDEMCDTRVVMRTDIVRRLLDAALINDIEIGSCVFERTPNNARIREALAKPCPNCHGLPLAADSQAIPGGQIEVTCRYCGDTGKATVTGARLEPRGEHLEIK